MAHKVCSLKYTSSDHISRYLKRKINGKQRELVPTKRTRRSNASFNFKKNCLFYANSCSIEPDSKHPGGIKPCCVVCCVVQQIEEKQKSRLKKLY